MYATEKEIENRFQVTLDISLEKRYNIAPTQNVLVITAEENERKANFFRWGLIPFWAKDSSIGNRMINARAETVDEKPSFKQLLSKKRCLIISSGFFEWKKTGEKKQPYFIHLKDNQPFSFAGLWDVWKQDDQLIHSCTIITTKPNELMMPIHDRMPVILDQDKETLWLDPNLTDLGYLKSLLHEYPSESMEVYPVSPKVGNPRNDSAENIQPIDI